MKKIILAVGALALAFAMGSTNANASATQITLSNSASCVSSTSTSITVTACQGNASGEGAFAGQSGSYYIGDVSGSGADTFNLSPSGFPAANTYTVGAQTAGTGLVFRFGTGSCLTSGSGCLLAGDLNLVSITSGGANGLGIVNLAGVANLTNLSGSDTGLFGAPQGSVDFTFNITSGAISSGEVAPSPEPTSLLLLGTGLLGVGIVVRRHMIA